jgi:hypothetical protein
MPLQFCPVELLIIEHVISMAAILKTNLKYKLLSVGESWLF